MSRKSDETRIRILRSAWTLLEESAGSGVRMSDIARKAGISRQALYLHFPTRAGLLVATTRYLDEVKDVDARLAASRAATTGTGRLEAFVDAWGNYIPEIYGVARALMVMSDTDPEAASAWAGRLQAVREGCDAAAAALDRDGQLAPELDPARASDLLWVLLSVRNWERLTQDCDWSQQHYIAAMQSLARKALVLDSA